MKIKYILSCVVVFIIIVVTALPVGAQQTIEEQEENEIACEAAIVIDADTLQVLYDKEMSKQMYPASLTKVMTALLVVENADLSDKMTVSSTAIPDYPNSTSINLEVGEVITVEDALNALLITSANDAANVLAEHIAGSQEAFVDMMNQRAHEIGAVKTRFNNAHGLPDDTHITTAYDLALITAEAVKNPDFVAHFGVPYATIEPTNKNEDTRHLYNLHQMLLQNTYLYSPDVIGGKTGYTKSAGSTLVTYAQRGNQNLICVVLKSSKIETFAETQKLLDSSFDDYDNYSVPIDKDIKNTIPIINDSGRQVGNATVSIPTNVKVTLASQQNRSGIKTETNIPQHLNKNNNIQPTIDIYYEEKGERTLLRSVPLSMQISLDMPSVSIESLVASENPEKTSILDAIVIRKSDYIFVALLFACIAALIILVVNAIVDPKPRLKAKYKRK